MSGRMHGYGRLTTENFTFEGYLYNNNMSQGLYQDSKSKLKFLGSFIENKPCSGTLWITVN